MKLYRRLQTKTLNTSSQKSSLNTTGKIKGINILFLIKKKWNWLRISVSFQSEELKEISTDKRKEIHRIQKDKSTVHIYKTQQNTKIQKTQDRLREKNAQNRK